jgi:hypothetical protein
MVTVRKAVLSQPGRRGNKIPMFESNIAEPPSHFDALHCQMWSHIVNYPTFAQTHSSFEELAAALDAHMVYCQLSDEAEAMRQNGERPERRLELARAAARRPLARFLKKLVIDRPPH